LRQRPQDRVALLVGVHSVIADSFFHLSVTPDECGIVVEKDEVR
jgi:hypothetical protein